MAWLTIVKFSLAGTVVVPEQEAADIRLDYSDTIIDGSTVSCGVHHTCVITPNEKSNKFAGPIICWGKNDHQQIEPPEGNFVQVACGATYCCGLREDEHVECWGAAAKIQGTFIQLSAGLDHVCALEITGHLNCWGRNSRGQANPSPGRFIQVSAGKAHSCGINRQGEPICWGSDTKGQLIPPGGIVFKQVEASYGKHSCGVEYGTGLIHCWGEDRNGQSTAPTDQSFAQLAVGRKYSCGIKAEDRTLLCWGRSSRPPQGAFREISSGEDHACGITLDKKILCWGHNTFDKLRVPENLRAI